MALKLTGPSKGPSTGGGYDILNAGINVANFIYQIINSERDRKERKKQQAYDKKIQKLTWEREDSAHQREIADLKRAGLNPLLSAGGGGLSSGPVVHVDAPTGDTPQMEQPDWMFPKLMMEALQMEKDFQKKDKEIQLLESQRKGTDVETAIKKRELDIQEEEDTSRSTPGPVRTVTAASRLLQKIYDRLEAAAARRRVKKHFK